MNPARSRHGAWTTRPVPAPARVATCRPVPASARRLRPPAWLLLVLCAWQAADASAQPVKPWVPSGTDSLVRQVAEAKVRFQGNQGDSIGGQNYRAYEMVGNVGRRLLRMMGRPNMIQARAVEALLDSLGLDTDVAVEQDLPYFTFLMVRNPFRPEAKSVGFLYWYKGKDLRMQGAQFSGGYRPQSRVWWTGDQDAPYSWGVVDFTRQKGAMHVTLFRLTSGGSFWTLAQYEDSGYELGSSGSTSWVDINGDLKPELLAWMPGEKDSLFEECADCPKRVTELVFAERREGFKLQDTRIVPTPYSTFALFVRLLTENNRAQAARLLKSPGLLEKAVAAGWAARRNRIWKVESAEPGTAWPEWLIVRFRGPQGNRRYAVTFELSRGRWVIRDWTERPIAPGDGVVKGRPPGSGGK